MTDIEKIAAAAERVVHCKNCDGRGWVGAATGSMFQHIGALAGQGRLPKTVCECCDGTGRELHAIAKEDAHG